MAVLISVVIPIYNQEKYIGDCLESVLPMCTDEVEVVLVNDGSTDRSESVCRDTMRRYSANVRLITQQNSGALKSRMKGIEDSTGEYILFVDSDDMLLEGALDTLLQTLHKKCVDMILFNVKAQEGRETYWNVDFAPVTWKNYGRYPAYAIAARREKLLESGVKYSLLFGGGAPYMNGEDSLFLHDCLKAGLKIYRTTVVLGHEEAGESTWFKGYTDKFFYDRGVLYAFLYGSLADILGFRFLFKYRKEMCAEKGLFKCFRLLSDGIGKGRELKKAK